MEPDDPLQNSNMEIANMLNIDINSKPDSKAKPMKKLGEWEDEYLSESNQSPKNTIVDSKVMVSGFKDAQLTSKKAHRPRFNSHGVATQKSTSVMMRSSVNVRLSDESLHSFNSNQMDSIIKSKLLNNEASITGGQFLEQSPADQRKTQNFANGKTLDLKSTMNGNGE